MPDKGREIQAVLSPRELPKAARSTLEIPKACDLRNDQLMFGSRGTRVTRLQHALTLKGYVLVRDGLFGLTSHRVVRQFQRDNHLPDTGVIDIAELALLLDNYGVGSWVRQINRMVKRYLSARYPFHKMCRKGLLSIFNRFT